MSLSRDTVLNIIRQALPDVEVTEGWRADHRTFPEVTVRFQVVPMGTYFANLLLIIDIWTVGPDTREAEEIANDIQAVLDYQLAETDDGGVVRFWFDGLDQQDETEDVVRFSLRFTGRSFKRLMAQSLQ